MARHPIDEGAFERVVKLLDDHGLTELEYGEGRWHIRVSRAAAGQPAAPAPAPPQGPESEQPEDLATQESAAAHPGAITSPMVGTVYLAPEPGTAPYVKVGDAVGEGQTLFLIEAMKTMNPITAPRPGRVAQIFARNASPVEYGEVLIILE
ncbi:MAG: acetyl-CoA carboxylase biotin carboxyl carrier protein subunit [Alphaproteobacteria bacterium]